MPERTPSTRGTRAPGIGLTWRAWPLSMAALLSMCTGAIPNNAHAGMMTPGTSRLAAFLQSRYGTTASLDRHWTTSGMLHGQHYDFVHRVCANHLTGHGKALRKLMAVCTTIDGGGHPEPGLVDVFLLDETTSAMRIAAEARGLEFGTFGIPGNVEVVRLGKRTYGLQVDWRDAGTGHAFVYRSFILPGGRSFTVAMTSLASHRYDGSGHCTVDDDAGCEQARIDMRFDARIDDSVPSRSHYPVRIHEHGLDCGRRIDRHHVLRFDTHSGTYPVDALLEREECLADFEAARSTTPPLLKRPQDSTSP